MQRWHSPWIVCITGPPPPLSPPASPPFKSAASTHTLWRWFSTWPALLQPEYLHSLLCAAECVLLGLCSDSSVGFRVLWIISKVDSCQRSGRGGFSALSNMSNIQVTVQLYWLQITTVFLCLFSIKRKVLGNVLFCQTDLCSPSTFLK